MDRTPRLDDGDTFGHRGRTFKIGITSDDSSRAPWKDYDGHGIVSERKYHPFGCGSKPPKGPGERILYWDAGYYQTYNVAETLKIARRDGWSCGEPSHTHTTARERAACAVGQNFEYLRAWCENEWFYAVIRVSLLDEDGNEIDEPEYLGGVEYGLNECYPHVYEEAISLADEIMARVEVDVPLAHLSEN